MVPVFLETARGQNFLKTSKRETRAPTFSPVDFLLNIFPRTSE